MSDSICIVGGGLVGLSAAIALASQGRRVTLLEARPVAEIENATQPDELDARSIALSHSTLRIFQALGLWNDLQTQTAPIKHIHVSSAGHFGVTRLDAKSLQLDSMGAVIEYHVLIQQLLQAALQQESIEIISPALVESVALSDQGVNVSYERDGQEQQLQADLLVIAEGASSSLRESLGIDITTSDYHQSAVVANVRVNTPQMGVAYERFTPDGPMAMLPLIDSRYALVWTQPVAKVESLLALSDKDFLQQLQQHFGYRLGAFSEVGRRAKFDLKLSRASKLVAGRSVLIGNAANALHPVAGQGFNLALRDVGVLHDCLRDIDLTSEVLPSRLQRYQQLRQADQQQTVSLGDGLVSLFSNNLPLLNHLRSAALGILDLCPPLKTEFSWQGMGFGKGLSSLMRGQR